MTIVPLPVHQLNEYVQAAIAPDTDIVRYFDRQTGVKTPGEAAESIMNKLLTQYRMADCYGVQVGGVKAGYFVTLDDYLVSFSLAPHYRNGHCLSALWRGITGVLGEHFNCVLYAYNHRAIDWLRRCGMQVSLQEVTILHYNTLNHDLCPQ